MTAVGLARARDISNRRELSIETVKRMKAYFDRHEVDKEGSTWEEQGKGWQAWNGWGGDAGRTWAEKIVSREESKTEAETKQQSMELAGMEVVQWLSRPEAKPVENGISDPTVRNAFAGYEDAVGRYRKQLYDRLEFGTEQREKLTAMDTKTQLDRLTELTILHRSQLRELASQLPGTSRGGRRRI
jgi:hypothetical protein